MPRPVEVQLRKTYFTLRIGVALMGMLLPLVLSVGGRLCYGLRLQPSMSAYYFATPAEPQKPDCNMPDVGAAVYPAGSMRNWFVGFLFAVGAMLFVNKGSNDKESLALTLAGLFAVGIAVFPMAWGCAAQARFSIHGLCAFLFFGAIAFVCVFCADDTLQFLNDPKTRSFFRRWYWFFAVVMIASPVTAWTLKVHRSVDRHVFWAETCGVLSFGAFWLMKSREIAIITKERKARGLGAVSATEAVPV